MSAAHQYEFVLLLLAAVAALEALARRLRLPPAAAFILGGAVIAVLPGAPAFTFDPELVLLVFLPPLLMSGGYFTAWVEFRSNLGAIGMLALGAVVFTTAVVGIVTHGLLPTLPWAVCFALGAIVSPPDAVAAAAVLKRLSLPARLTATLEGESLLNDASGLVLFRFAVAAALTGTFSIIQASTSFVVLSVGGVVLGYAVGRIGILLLRRAEGDTAILITLLLPAAAYVGGERLGVSGVLATVAAGIVVGRRQHGAISAATRIRAQAFWSALTFLLESLLFVLIGLALHDVLGRIGAGAAARSLLIPVAGVVIAVVVARMMWMYATWAGRHVARRLGFARVATPSLSTATVLGWAGMRGVVTLAAALSLPEALPGRDVVIVAAFATILVTVLVQGTTLGPLIRLVGITGDEDAAMRREHEARARAHVARAQLGAIANISRQTDGTERHPRLLEQYGRRAALTAAASEDAEEHDSHRAEHHTAVLHGIEAARREALRLHMAGAIHDETLRAIEWELDLEQLASESRL